MQQETFNQFRQLIYNAGGISLAENKSTLLRTRIRGRMIKLKLNSPDQYLAHIRKDTTGRELTHLIDSIATNYTFFFREEKHFDTLKKQIRELIESGKKRIRIWSSACSSGEEPYTIAMVVLGILNDMRINPNQIDIKILATDISTKILRKAMEGVYHENQIARVPKNWQSLYFKALNSESGNLYQVSQTLKDMISFRHLNLNAPQLPVKGPIDAIFCRNVMIYFDEQTRKVLVNKFSKTMPDNALLYIGMSESIINYCDELPYVEPSVYRKTSISKRTTQEQPALAGTGI